MELWLWVSFALGWLCVAWLVASLVWEVWLGCFDLEPRLAQLGVTRSEPRLALRCGYGYVSYLSSYLLLSPFGCTVSSVLIQ